MFLTSLCKTFTLLYGKFIRENYYQILSELVGFCIEGLTKNV